MSKLKLYCLIIFSISIFELNYLPVYAQSSKIEFEHITAKEGLLQSTINCIFQDSRNFMWFGTEEGLNMYDGYKFYSYQSELGNHNSLKANSIQSIYETENNILWISTYNGGLSKLNLKTNVFTNYTNDPNDENSLSNNIVFSVIQDKNNPSYLWIATNNGLNRLNTETQHFEHFFTFSEKSKQIAFRNFFFDSEKSLWISSIAHGLFKYDWSSNSFQSFKMERNSRLSQKDNSITTIIEENQKVLWLGTFGGGLKKFNKFSGKVVHYTKGTNNLSDDYIRQIVRVDTNTLWIATRNGINIFNTRTNRSKVLTNKINDPTSISTNFIMSILKDRSDIIWVGTFGGGLNKYDRFKNKFKLYRHDPGNENSLSNNYVTSLFYSNKKDLWIGTWQGGLNKLDLVTSRFSFYNMENNSLGDNSIYAILEDNLSNLWVGTSNGLDVLYNQQSEFIHYNFLQNDSISVGNNVIRSIYQSSDGNILIGTDNGLNKYDGGKFKKYLFSTPEFPNGNRIFDIYEDGDNRFWLASGEGFIEFFPETGEYKKYVNEKNNSKSIGHNWVWVIHEDTDGNLWLGTRGGGLNKFNKKHQTFEHFTTENGLPSNVIVGILEDNFHNLWISSQRGLSKFNLSSYRIRNYTVNDNLQGTEFNGGSFYQNSDGEMFFGGTNGFNSFNPNKILENPNIPNIAITDFLILNKSVKVGPSSFLTQSISFTDELKLNYDQNSFSFEFAALNYSFPEDNQFSYKLEGFDDDWVNSGNRHYASYTNIDPGNYIFRVIGSNNDGVWNDVGTSIKIEIVPPFWTTWWFILMAILIIGSMIIYFLYYNINNLLAVERYRLKIAADLHDDIGTSLTEISMLSDLLKHTEKDLTKSQLEIVSRVGNSARKLIDNMRDIIWLINPKRDSLYELLLKIRDNYEELLSHKNIDLYLENVESLQKIRLSMEYRKNLHLLIKESINNSVKHSNCSKIFIRTKVHRKIIEFEIEDNGKGFDINNETLGSGIENIKKRAEEFGGTINISSTENEGTLIHFSGKIF